ncbi:hypothetical protein DWV02_25550, partial [Citrobacter freundii]
MAPREQPHSHSPQHKQYTPRAPPPPPPTNPPPPPPPTQFFLFFHYITADDFILGLVGSELC